MPLRALAVLLLAASAFGQDGPPQAPQFKFQKSRSSGAGAPAAPSGPCAPDTAAAPAGPSDPVGKAAVLAAIKEYAGSNRGIATAWFSKAFPAMPVFGGPDAAFHEGYVAVVADQLRQMVEKDMIVVTALPGHADASADWGGYVGADGYLTGGEMRLSGLERVVKLGASASRCSELGVEDGFAEAVLHETAHMFHSALTCMLGGKDTLSGYQVRSKFTYETYWKGGTLGFCSGAQCASCGIDEDGKRTYALQGAHATRGDANEYLAREIPYAMCRSDECKAHARVLQAAFDAAAH